MPLWTQHLLVILLVAGCLSLVGWQAFQSLRGRKSKLGQCCAKGCSPDPQPAQTQTQTQTQTATQTEKIHFMPAEMLTRRK